MGKQGVHEAAHFKMRPLPCLLAFQIDRMQIQAAAKDVITAGYDHGSCAAFPLLYLIERQMHRPDNRDIDRVAHRRALDRQSRNSVGNRER
jgi:hypothetical protein